MKRIGIFGTSGMARDAGDIAWELGYTPVYVARDQRELDEWSFSGDVILEESVNRFSDMNYTIGIGDNKIRQAIATEYSDRLRFISLIHPSASFGVAQRQVIEGKRGIIISAGVRFTNNIRVGDFCIFNLNATISHDVVIDEFVYVAPGAHITGNIHVGARAWIGIGVAINQGSWKQKLLIGNDTMIGSGSVVIENCDANSVYVGVPAKKIK